MYSEFILTHTCIHILSVYTLSLTRSNSSTSIFQGKLQHHELFGLTTDLCFLPRDCKKFALSVELQRSLTGPQDPTQSIKTLEQSSYSVCYSNRNSWAWYHGEISTTFHWTLRLMLIPGSLVINGVNGDFRNNYPRHILVLYWWLEMLEASQKTW